MDDKDWVLLKTLNSIRNLSRTADVLYVSQPSLSYRIRNLEEEFQVKIFMKTKSGIEMTPEGIYLAKYAEKMLQQFQTAKDEVIAINNNISGVLRLGVSSNYSYYVLPELLRSFSNHHSDIKFQVKTGWSQKLYELLNTGEIQVAIVRNDFKGKRILIEDDHFYIISKRKIDLDRLPFLPMITYKLDNELDSLIKEWWLENYSDPPMVEMEADRLETCKRMVKNDFGYAIVPSICLDDIGDYYKQEIYFKSGEPVVRKTWLMYNEEMYDNLSSVRRFVDFLDKKSSNLFRIN